MEFQSYIEEFKWIPLQEPTMKEKKAYCAEFGILNDLADELADESKDLGTLDNKILEVRIVVIKYLKATEKKNSIANRKFFMNSI